MRLLKLKLKGSYLFYVPNSRSYYDESVVEINATHMKELAKTWQQQRFIYYKHSF